MAETLGALCDKLTIVKLKEFHSDDPVRLQSLALQEQKLKGEIDDYIAAALSGIIPLDRLTFASNKVFKREGNDVAEVQGGIAEVFGKLAEVNCLLWHEQEKAYDFERVPLEEKNRVVKNLALLNLERNACIDSIALCFRLAWIPMLVF